MLGNRVRACWQSMRVYRQSITGNNAARILCAALSVCLLSVSIGSVQAQEARTAGAPVMETGQAGSEQVIEATKATAPGASSLTNHIYLPLVQVQSTEIASGTGEDGMVEAAWVHTWNIKQCLNVNSNERDFWDDAPGAGVGTGAASDNNESGLLWFITNSTANEWCSYSAFGNFISTSSFPRFRIRAAVSDGASLKVEVFGSAGDLCSQQVMASYTIPANYDESTYHAYEFTLPANQEVCEVSIKLDDDPDNYPSDHAFALIDNVRIYNPTTGATGWFESFQGN